PKPRRPTRRTFPTACRYRTNWRGARSGCASWPRRARRSRRGPRNAMRASRLSTKPKLAARQAKAEESGKKPGCKPPEPPVAGPRPNDQINLTDEESRIMPGAGGGFDQCYNAQAAVAAGSLLVVANAVSQAPNDKQQLEPMLDKIGALPDELGKPERLLADTGYFSAANVAACEKTGIEPLIAMGRQPHHPPLAERF